MPLRFVLNYDFCAKISCNNLEAYMTDNQSNVLLTLLLFLLYRKFLKSSEIVYNGLEIKNDITKERRGLRHDVVMKFFVLV